MRRLARRRPCLAKAGVHLRSSLASRHCDGAIEEGGHEFSQIGRTAGTARWQRRWGPEPGKRTHAIGAGGKLPDTEFAAQIRRIAVRGRKYCKLQAAAGPARA